MTRPRIAALIVSIVMVLTPAIAASPANAAPPGFSGCSLIDDGRPQLQQDQYGSWVWAILKYRCDGAREYEFLGTLYQDPDSQGGYEIGSIYRYGVETAPYSDRQF